jgi:uncharacterized protein involved in tolerance to divalent cations
MPDLVIVLTTMPDDARADELARTLVDDVSRRASTSMDR